MVTSALRVKPAPETEEPQSEDKVEKIAAYDLQSYLRRLWKEKVTSDSSGVYKL